MSARLATIARDKELLLMRSALCRLRLQRTTLELRNSLQWRRAAGAVAAAPAARRIAFGLALSLIGPGRARRVIVLAGRVLLAAGIARWAIASLNRAAGPRVCAIERTDPGDFRSLGNSTRSPK